MSCEETKLVIDKDLEDLVPGYVESIISDLRLILQALEESDFETAKTLSHRMKGSGGGYGIQRISDSGLIMEKASSDKNSELVRQETESLIHYLQSIQIRYE